MTAVSSKLGIDKDNLLKDFNSDSVPNDVKTILLAKSNTLLDATKGESTLAGVKTATASIVGSMSLPSNIDVVKAK